MVSVSQLLRLGAAVLGFAVPALAGFAAGPAAERAAVDAAHRELWRRFVNGHGIVHDYTGLGGEVLLPTPEECRAMKPNALGWSTPIEDGAFFNGLYLDGLCRRWRVTGDPADAEKARRIAAGLILLSEVGTTPGFIARGVASDGRSHYPASSSDQTYPWFYGMWRYATSGIPTPEERARFIAALVRVARGLEANNWEMPVDRPDRPDFGHFGHWTVGFAGTKGIYVGAEPNFDAAARFLFVLRALHHVTGDAHWLAEYERRLAETPVGADRSRLEICGQGVDYVPPGENAQFPERPRLWTSASSQAGLRALIELEPEAARRAVFQRGLDANARRAAKFIGGYRRYDNDNSLAFDIRWRALNAIWREQKSIGEAVQLGREQKGDGSIWHRQSPRFWTESVDMRDPLWSAWVVALSGNPEIIGAARADITGALTHYRWERLHTGFFFIAECVYWQLAGRD